MKNAIAIAQKNLEILKERGFDFGYTIECEKYRHGIQHKWDFHEFHNSEGNDFQGEVFTDMDALEININEAIESLKSENEELALDDRSIDKCDIISLRITLLDDFDFESEEKEEKYYDIDFNDFDIKINF